MHTVYTVYTVYWLVKLFGIVRIHEYVLIEYFYNITYLAIASLWSSILQQHLPWKQYNFQALW